MLYLSEVLPDRLQPENRPIALVQRRLFLELIDLLQEQLASNATLLCIVAQVSQSVLDLRDNLDDGLAGVELPLEDLCEDLVDIVGITAIHSDLQGLVVLLHLQIEGNLLHDLLLVDDEIVTELLLA